MPPGHPLAAEEVIIRFVYDKRDVRSDGTIRYQAFLPRLDNNNIHSVSVFRKDDRDDNGWWSLGDSLRAESDGKKVIARGEVLASGVTALGLTLNPDDEPPGHVNIESWPVEKQDQILRAQKLSALSRVVRR